MFCICFKYMNNTQKYNFCWFIVYFKTLLHDYFYGYIRMSLHQTFVNLKLSGFTCLCFFMFPLIVKYNSENSI